MSDFCLDCAEELGFRTDLANITTPEEWAAGEAAVVLCEGCGVIQVDPNGKRAVPPTPKPPMAKGTRV